jgi:hypothetical protein
MRFPHFIGQLPIQVEFVTQIHFFVILTANILEIIRKGLEEALFFNSVKDLKNGYNKRRRGLFAYIF